VGKGNAADGRTDKDEEDAVDEVLVDDVVVVLTVVAVVVGKDVAGVIVGKLGVVLKENGGSTKLEWDRDVL